MNELQNAIQCINNGNFQKADQILRHIKAKDERNFDAVHMLGIVCSELGKFYEAEQFFKIALSIDSKYPPLYRNYGLFLNKTKRFREAIEKFNIAIDLAPNFPPAYSDRGNSRRELGQLDEAINDHNRAISFAPDFFGFYNNRGNALQKKGCHLEALSDFDAAIKLNRNCADAHCGRGNVYRDLKQYDEAFAAYEKALSLNPLLAEAWLGRGNVYFELKRYDDALAAYDRALTSKPDLAEAWFGRGNVYGALRLHDNASTAYRQALNLKPDLNYAAGAHLHAKMHLCDWAEIEAQILHVIAAVRDRKTVSDPFVLLSIPASSDDQLQCAKTFLADRPSFAAFWRGEIYSHQRIRIGYFSADFRRHPVAELAVGLFEHHDKSRFETTAISFGPDDGSDLRYRIKSAVEDFVDVHAMTDDQIAEFIRRREIDLIVDLTGLTDDNRVSVLARRVAPIQVNFLGYPGTTGADFMDYIIADPTIIPKEHFPFYSERVVWLPDTYQPNDIKRRIADRRPTRSECNLPEAAFVFCCFNYAFKITPQLFAIWTRILASTEHSVLWLLETNPTAAQNLRREVQAHGISPDRLIFAPRMPIADHLARIGLADLFLDTLPYNAHTTASDALWAGLPVLTCLGETFASRVGASLLKAVDLSELVTTSLEQYEALALKLAHDPMLVGAIKVKLAQNRETCPLFDTARFTRHIEAAYVTMWQRYQRREMPVPFAVVPIN